MAYLISGRGLLRFYDLQSSTNRYGYFGFPIPRSAALWLSGKFRAKCGTILEFLVLWRAMGELSNGR